MGTLQRSNWKAWNPNGDELESSPAGLVRADNITFEEEGVAKLTRGTVRRSNGAFASVVNGIYSSDLLASTVGLVGGRKKVRYVSYNGNVVRNYCAPNFTEDEFSGGFLSGGDTGGTAFATAWGHNFAFSGSKKRADKGLAASWRDVGIPAPLAPGVAQNTPPENPVIGAFPLANWTTVEQASNSTGADFITLEVNHTTLRGIFQSQTYGGTATWDTTDFTATGQDTPNDIFQVPIRISDSSKLIKVRCELLLDSPQAPSTTQDVTDFFWFEWYSNEAVNTNPSYIDPTVFEFTDRQAFIDSVRQQLEPGIALETFFREGTNFWGNIQARRYQFKRSGVDATKDWTTVKAFRFIITATDIVNIWIGEDIKFIGGTLGPLSDSFSYIQVNVNDTGEYVEYGLSSPASTTIQVFQSSIHVTPAAAPGNANKIKIYRASTHTPGYYLVKEGAAPLAAFDDTVSDVDALRDGILLEDYRTALPNGIQIALGPYYDRMILFDLDTMYATYRYDPGSYDSRHAFQITGSENEYILWARQVIDGVILVGTTKDIYQVTGNFAYDEATGLLDVTIVGYKIAQPPVSSASTVHSNVLYYLAEDGWRSVAGSASNSIIGSIDLLFRGHSRHGIGYVNVGANGISDCCVSKNRLITSMDFSDLGRAILYYDFTRQSWNFWHNDVNFTNNAQVLYAESDGTVLFSTTDTGDRYLYEWDSGTTLGEGANQALRLRTIYDSDGKPNNRKEALTLKVQADTGGLDLTLRIRSLTDSSTYSDLAFNLNCNGSSIKFYDISALGKGKRYQIEVEGFAQTFKLYEFAIEYIDLPVQLNYLVLKPSNLGTAGRKRLPIIPMIIDTLGNDVTFQSILDGVLDEASIVNTSDKAVYNHIFTDNTVATNVGGILSCATGVFEFYELVSPRDTEILPDPLKFKWIPTTNFGTTKRKRFGQLAFIIDTKGVDVVFTPYIDGVAYPTQIYNTTNKETVIYYFPTLTVGIDFRATLQSFSTDFEFYEMALADCSYEILPTALTFIAIPTTNFNTTKRKRFGQLAFVIDTKGNNVVFTPYIDGVAKPTQTYNTTSKDTVFYYFLTETIGVDFRATLSSATNPFEFYDLALSDCTYEVLPPAVVYRTLANTNYGIAAKKRIRTLPFVIDTKGNNVTYTPIVDGQTYNSSTFNTNGKLTQLHYFTQDIFGIDYGGILSGSSPFEFYEALQPENVETLPVGKKWDQLGPVEFNRQARVRGIRYRVLPEGNQLTFRCYAEDVLLYTKAVPVTVNKEQTVEISLPKGITATVLRVEIASSAIFHRFKGDFKVDVTGAGTDWKWMPVK